MKKILLFVISSIMCVNLFIPTVMAENSEYSDYEITQDTQFADIFGLMTGYEDGTFRPDNPITRAEFVTSIMRAASIAYPDIKADNISFYDMMDKSYWAYEDIAKAVSMGFVNGFEDGTFRPDDKITYEQAAGIVFKMLGYAPVLDMYGGFPDAYMSLAYYDGFFKTASGSRKGLIEMNSAKQKTPINRHDAMLMLDLSLFIPICYVTDYKEGNNGLEAIYNLGGDGVLKNNLYSMKYVDVTVYDD